jgi:hypothetical protein
MAGETGVIALRKFFEKDAKPVPMSEMQEFWKSLSNQEKTDFVASAEKQMAVV